MLIKTVRTLELGVARIVTLTLTLEEEVQRDPPTRLHVYQAKLAKIEEAARALERLIEEEAHQ